MYLIALPTAFLFINIIAPLFFPWSNNSVFFSTEYDFMTLILVLLLSNLIIVLTGFVLKNKYTQLSANRAAVMAVNLDISMGFFISYFVLIFGTFNITSLIKIKSTVWLFTVILPVVPSLFYMVLMDLGKAPFDLVEAETELIMGFHSDYSGFLFVLFLLGEYIHMIILSYLFGLLIR
jgi:NADH-quinone oxidoreductase subunit H